MKTTKDLVHEFADFEKKQDHWDQVPMMIIATEPEPGEDSALILLALAIDGDLPDALTKMALAITRGGVVPWGAGMGKPMGMVLIWEGWGVPPDAVSDYSEVIAYSAAGGRFADHPLAKETKGLLGVDGEGMYTAQFFRGEDISFVDGGGEGRLVDAVRGVWAVMNGEGV